MKTTTSSLVAEKLCLEDKIESSQNLHTDTETQTNRSSISPPCDEFQTIRVEFFETDLEFGSDDSVFDFFDPTGVIENLWSHQGQ